MKTLFVLLITALSLSAKAQTTEYDTCQYLHQFEGEWRSVNGTDTIKVFLKTARMWSMYLDRLDDFVIGWHEYKRGNTVVESDYGNIRTTFPAIDTLTGYSIGFKINQDSCTGNNNTITGYITDYLQSKEGHRVRITLNSIGTMMTWQQEHREGYGAFTGAYGMTLPKQFILTKQ